MLEMYLTAVTSGKFSSNFRGELCLNEFHRLFADMFLGQNVGEVMYL